MRRRSMIEETAPARLASYEKRSDWFCKAAARSGVIKRASTGR